MSTLPSKGGGQNEAAKQSFRNNKILSLILRLPRTAKIAVVVVTDINICAITVFLAFYVRLGELSANTAPMVTAAAVSVLLALPIFFVMGLYRAIFRHSGAVALINVARAIGVYSSAYITAITFIGIDGIPRTIGLIQPVLLLVLVGASRAFARLIFGDVIKSRKRQNSLPQMLVYGAGKSGRQLAAAIATADDMQLVGFLDEDRRLHGHQIDGKVVFDPKDIQAISQRYNITDVCLAMPSISPVERKRIADSLLPAPLAVRTIPKLSNIASGAVKFSALQPLDINDLLGRDPVAPNQILMTKNIFGRKVLVTGAGGSIGSELCRQIANCGPSVLLLVDNNEFSLYKIHHELTNNDANAKVRVVPILASVLDEKRVTKIVSDWRPETLYHAAAYKHVPLVEQNPTEGINNNIFGTFNLANAAVGFGVSDFVLISTDKAVRPTNVMGASKRFAEMLLQAMSERNSRTKFTLVRFGNVLGSSGSVVPRFDQQINAGGPVTVTHQEVTRFFMTIPEAAQLVIQAGALTRGADVFVLDMGKPVRIVDLAKRMIFLAGRTLRDDENPSGEIEIQITGLRPGEKLYEELLLSDNPEPTLHPKIMRAKEDFLSWDEMQKMLNRLRTALRKQNAEDCLTVLQRAVNGYSRWEPDADLVDDGG